MFRKDQNKSLWVNNDPHREEFLSQGPTVARGYTKEKQKEVVEVVPTPYLHKQMGKIPRGERGGGIGMKVKVKGQLRALSSPKPSIDPKTLKRNGKNP